MLLGEDSPSTVQEIEPVTNQTKVAVLTAVVLPFIGLIVGIVLLWGYGFSWLHLVMMLIMYALSAVGVTAGFHRLFTHRSFETIWPVKLTLAILGSMAVQGPVLKWVATHRRHHQHSDTEGDPHSPHLHGKGFLGTLRGLWHSHVGWLLEPDAPSLYTYVGDLVNDRLVSTISKTFPLWVAIGLIIPAVIAGLITGTWFGALLGFIWGGLARVFIGHHVTWSINSVCHVWGGRPFRSRDQSRNNAIFGILGFGEGWHNNHHAFPTSARHGLRWWEIDTTYWLIRTLELFGLAWKVRIPEPAAIAAKLQK